MNRHDMKRTAIVFLWGVLFWLAHVFSFSQVVDRIMAVVNEEVITLTDVRIAEAFGLYADEIGEDVEQPRLLILDQLIDQKVVIQFSGENVRVNENRLDEVMRRITERLGADEAERRLDYFGLDWENLKDCVREKVVYQTIISQKFSKVNPVSLKEIEEYYQNNYLPAQREKGSDPKPMMEILDELEDGIIQEKVRAQIEDWIRKLKDKSSIQIMKGSLKPTG